MSDLTKMSNEELIARHARMVDAQDGRDDAKEHLRSCEDELLRRLSGRWTRVEDGLPESGDTVLVYLAAPRPTGRMFINHRTGAESNTDWWKAFVTHWMPLPEPPAAPIEEE